MWQPIAPATTIPGTTNTTMARLCIAPVKNACGKKMPLTQKHGGAFPRSNHIWKNLTSGATVQPWKPKMAGHIILVRSYRYHTYRYLETFLDISRFPRVPRFGAHVMEDDACPSPCIGWKEKTCPQPRDLVANHGWKTLMERSREQNGSKMS